MASFVIHKIAADKLLELLENEYNISLSEEEKNIFHMGNLIVDSTRTKKEKKETETEIEAKKRYSKNVQQEKISTHFRGEDDLELCIQTPQLDKFTSKYQELLSKGNIPTIAYLFHLFTDKYFFEELFTATFETLDEELNPTIYTSKTKHMLVKKNNKLYSVEQFWDSSSDQSIYHDYTTMNKILLKHFNSSFDEEKLYSLSHTFINPGIDEVDFENLPAVIKKTSQFIKESYESKSNTLNIFDEEQIKQFIEDNASSFLTQYGNYFGIQIDTNKQYQKQQSTRKEQ